MRDKVGGSTKGGKHEPDASTPPVLVMCDGSGGVVCCPVTSSFSFSFSSSVISVSWTCFTEEEEEVGLLVGGEEDVFHTSLCTPHIAVQQLIPKIARRCAFKEGGGEEDEAGDEEGEEEKEDIVVPGTRAVGPTCPTPSPLSLLSIFGISSRVRSGISKRVDGESTPDDDNACTPHSYNAAAETGFKKGERSIKHECCV